MISGSRDGAVMIWEKENGKLKEQISNKILPISSLAVSNCGNFIAYSCYDNEISIWKNKIQK